MLNDEVEDWEQLCRDAVEEKDPDKLMAIIERLNNILGRGDEDRSGSLKQHSQ